MCAVFVYPLSFDTQIYFSEDVHSPTMSRIIAFHFVTFNG